MLSTWTFAIRPAPSNAILYIRPFSLLCIVHLQFFGSPRRPEAEAELSRFHHRRLRSSVSSLGLADREKITNLADLTESLLFSV